MGPGAAPVRQGAAATLTSRLAGDLRRGFAAATGAALAIALIEAVATLVAYPGPLGTSIVARFLALDAMLLLLAWTVAAPLTGVVFVLPRLAIWFADGRAAARAYPGPAMRPVPRAWMVRAWALVGVAAVYFTWSTRATRKGIDQFKEHDLLAMLLSVKQLIVVAALVLLAQIVAIAGRRRGAGRRRLVQPPRAAWLDARWGSRWAARHRPRRAGRGRSWSAGSCTRRTSWPPLRPLVPWRWMLVAAAALSAPAPGARPPRPDRLRGRAPRPPAAPRVGASGLAAVLVPLTLMRCGADPDAKGVAIASSPLLGAAVAWVRKANDLDGDGFGSMLGEKDCAPFDATIRPGVRDMPDNGIDQNCDGRDFSMRDLMRLKKGDRMEVPEAFRRDWNVLLLTVDTVRYDHTSFGGYRDGPKARDTTPRLAELVSRAVSFTFANSPSAGTMASIPAILTSRFFHSGIALDETNRKPKMAPRLKPENTTLPEIMKRDGYTTGAILSHEYFNDWGMEQGVDDYDNSIGKKPDPFRISSHDSTDRAISWISRHSQKKWFLWVHYLDPHGRYVAHPDDADYGSSEEDLYDSELHYTDKHLGRLLDEIARLPGGDRTIVVITSDHGDAFNEHGFVNHGQALYRELLHVPLVIYVPDLPPRQVGGAVSPLDIVPTVADLCGIDVSDLRFEGKSLISQLFTGEEDPDRVVFAETNYPKPLRAAISKDYKLIYDLQNNLYQLYRLSADPWEKTNLATKDPQALAEMQQPLDAWLARVMFERDPVFNQALAKSAGILLDAAPTPAHPLAGTTFDDGKIEVIGYEAEPVGVIARAGTKLTFAVYFKVAQRPSGAYKLQGSAWLVEQAGFDPRAAVGKRVSRSSQRITADGYLPSDRWNPGEYIRETFTVSLPVDWASGPDDAIAVGVTMTSPAGKVNVVGTVSAGDPAMAVLGLIPLHRDAPAVDAGAGADGNGPPAPPVQPRHFGPTRLAPTR